MIHSDVVVSGGGAAGVAAALAAAESGLKVVLVEKNSFLGGSATAAEVGTICGLYKFSKKNPAEYCCTRFAREFAGLLSRQSGTTPHFNAAGLHYLPYHIEDFKAICLRLLQQKQVQVLCNTAIVRVAATGSRVEAVTVHAPDQAFEIQLSSIVDCSGHSTVSSLLGLPVIESDNYQAAAQVFTLQQVNAVCEDTLGLVLTKALHMAIAQQQLPAYFNRVYIVPGSLKDKNVSLKIGIPLAVDYSPGNLEAVKATGHQFLRELTTWLSSHCAPFSQASIAHIAPEPGIRVGVRTRGKYILTEADVLGCAKFEDAIAYGCWPIEYWQQDRRAQMTYFAENDYYHVPAGCLQSCVLDNLFVAGRCISATDAAVASARVIGTCLQTGYAAGWLAATEKLQLTQAAAIKIIQRGECIS